MNTSRSQGKELALSQGLTLLEILVVVATLAVLAFIMIPALPAPKMKAARINCVNNLKECGLAAKIWEGNHNDRYPGETSITNGGAAELLAAGNVAAYFQIMSNELATPKELICPADEEHIFADSFTHLTRTNISYFVSLTADDSCPQMPFSGDDNFAINGFPVKSGLQNLWTNRSVSWADKRHYRAGNIGLVDGSVEQLSNLGLTDLVGQPNAGTNWVVVP